MPPMSRLASVAAGCGRRPLQVTLRCRLVSRTSIYRASVTALHHQQARLPVVPAKTRLFCSSKSDVDSEHVVSEGGLLLPRHQTNASSTPGVQKISVNRSGLLPARGQYSEDFKSDKQGLTRELEQMIHINGPMAVAEYMLYALQHPTFGYYMRAENKIGQRGDFVTAPEISQVFGEMICIWCVATWRAMGTPFSFNLVELGPGKGTLMVDILRAAKSFPAFRRALTVHLVETSDDLEALQVKALNAKFPEDTRTDPPPPPPSSVPPEGGDLAERRLGLRKRPGMDLPDGGNVFWHSKIDQVPQGPSLFIAQEFLDALPVHQFEYTANGWREVLVDLNTPESKLKLESESKGAEAESTSEVESRKGVIAGTGVKESTKGDGENGAEQPKEDFRFVVSAAVTEAVNTFLKSKEDALSSSPAAAAAASVGTRGEKIGDRLEVSPESMMIVADVAKRIAQHGGGALFVDYGENHALENSLRSFKGHKEVPVLSDPGLADMTADVDFSLLRRIASAVQGVKTHGPVTQKEFLGEMGIVERLKFLAEEPHITEEQLDMISEGYVRLVDPEQMGTRYKVLGIVDEGQSEAPPGFLSAESQPTAPE